MALPNNEELSILPAFRNKVADILTEKQLNDDMFLLRWLRARELDEDAAEALLRNALQWRKENNLDTLEVGKASPSFIYENYPKFTDGVDKDGRPVFSCPFKYWDVRKAINEGMLQDFIFYLGESFEEFLRLIQANAELYPAKPGQPPVTQFIMILDWQDFPWGQLFNYRAVQGLLKAGSIYEAYFPEILHACYFINCPALISTFLALLKPVIAPRTMAKIKVFGSDKTKWQEELLQNIDPHQLRPGFGGTKEDSDDNDKY